MDIRYIIFALGSSLLLFLYLFLSYLVIMQRRKHRLAYLTNDDKAFIARVRAHANFSEYVPFTLILMAVAIVFQIHYLLLAILMLGLIIARIFHAIGLIRKESRKQFNYRFYSVSTTFVIMSILAVYNFLKALMVLPVSL